MIIENSLKHGFLQAIWDFLTMHLQLSSIFYTFPIGTRSHLLVGLFYTVEQSIEPLAVVLL